MRSNVVQGPWRLEGPPVAGLLRAPATASGYRKSSAHHHVHALALAVAGDLLGATQEMEKSIAIASASAKRPTQFIQLAAWFIELGLTERSQAVLAQAVRDCRDCPDRHNRHNRREFYALKSPLEDKLGHSPGDRSGALTRPKESARGA